MKKARLVLVVIIFLLISVINSGVLFANNAKFYPPLPPGNSLTVLQTYHTAHGNRAIDFTVEKNTSVYAVGDGVITTITPDGGRYIRLDLFDSDIIVYYVHVDPVTGLSVGDTVLSGEQIGIISPHYSPPHLHLGLAWKTLRRCLRCDTMRP